MTRLARHYVAAIAVIVIVLCTFQLLRFPSTPTTSAEADANPAASRYDKIQKGWQQFWQSATGATDAKGSQVDDKALKDSSSFGEEEDPPKMGNDGAWATPSVLSSVKPTKASDNTATAHPFSASWTAGASTAAVASPTATSKYVIPADDFEEDEKAEGKKLTKPKYLPLAKDFDPTKHVFDVPENIVYDPAGPRPDQVILLTASDGKGHNGGIENIMETTAENRKLYCEHHGYINQFVNISKYDMKGAHAVWAKLPAIIEAFQTHPQAQWVWWLDLDAIIMTPSVSLNSLLLSHASMRKAITFGKDYVHGGNKKTGSRMGEKDDVDLADIDLLVAQDHNGVNAGSFLLRRSVFTQMLMDLWRDPLFVQQPWEGREQEVLRKLIVNHSTVRQHVGLIGQRVINSYPQGGDIMGWREGDLIVHMAGCWVSNHCQEWWRDFWNKKKSV
ncbi:glycosyltransferase family 34 protein [Aulographum hederae CBS 113979]|uniref:Glycosyltransferase family 34 protein n=1 Tax=Aulographum hederae CBS 113979 TaxID=1176131 RepID=A0A6G1HEZ0_9PEZI|nr:glycosyltransferase family 34 protein [Aulographum hederae CBS 113979]